MSKFFENIFSKKQYGLRRGYRTQYCLLALAMVEKWKASVFGVLLTDLSKVVDCLMVSAYMH